MHEQRHHAGHCCGSVSRGPEVFYGYCHESGRMRMMDYADFVNNVQTGYANLYNNPASALQPMVGALSNLLPSATMTYPGRMGSHHHHHHHEHEHECRCGC